MCGYLFSGVTSCFNVSEFKGHVCVFMSILCVCVRLSECVGKYFREVCVCVCVETN